MIFSWFNFLAQREKDKDNQLIRAARRFWPDSYTVEVVKHFKEGKVDWIKVRPVYRLMYDDSERETP